MCPQHLRKGLRPAGSAAKEDHNIPVSDRTVFLRLLIQHPFFSYNFLYPVGNGKSFQCTGILAFHQIFQFFRILFHKKNLCWKKFLPVSIRKFCSRIKGRSLVIGNPTKIFSHDLTENKIGTVQYLGSASEVFVQVDPLLVTIR